jgi:hypothetical protein
VLLEGYFLSFSEGILVVFFFFLHVRNGGWITEVEVILVREYWVCEYLICIEMF